MSQRLVATRSGNTAGAAAIVTLTALTLLLLFSLVGFPNLVSGSGEPKTSVGSQSVSAQAAAQAGQGCPLPSLPSTSPIGPNWGPSPFTFVGASTACANVSPATVGVNSTTSFNLTLDASRPLLITLGIADDENTTTSVPIGTTYSSTVGTQSLKLSDNLAFSKPTIIQIPTGQTTFDFKVSVPNPYRSATYHFTITVSIWSDSSMKELIYASDIPVNLVAE